MRTFDVIAVAALAVVLLLPKPSLDARPALEGEKIELDRVAAQEDALFAAPDDIDRAVALADSYLRLLKPEWTLATLAKFSESNDHRVHLLMATARAERLEPALCVAAVERGLKACDAEGSARCTDASRTRFAVIQSGMKSLVDAGIDPRRDPKRAREAVAGVLHAAKAKGLSGSDKKK